MTESVVCIAEDLLALQGRGDKLVAPLRLPAPESSVAGEEGAYAFDELLMLVKGNVAEGWVGEESMDALELSVAITGGSRSGGRCQ